METGPSAVGRSGVLATGRVRGGPRGGWAVTVRAGGALRALSWNFPINMHSKPTSGQNLRDFTSPSAFVASLVVHKME